MKFKKNYGGQGTRTRGPHVSLMLLPLFTRVQTFEAPAVRALPYIRKGEWC
jgi:hypothetical protein